jgi:hypothetical protein
MLVSGVHILPDPELSFPRKSIPRQTLPIRVRAPLTRGVRIIVNGSNTPPFRWPGVVRDLAPREELEIPIEFEPVNTAEVETAVEIAAVDLTPGRPLGQLTAFPLRFKVKGNIDAEP